MPDFEDPNETESFVHDIFPTGMALMTLALCSTLTLIVLGGGTGGNKNTALIFLFDSTVVMANA